MSTQDSTTPETSFTPGAKIAWRDLATFVVAMVVVLGFFAFIFLFWGQIAKDTQGIVIGVLLGTFGSAVGYYVNSSIGSSAKNEWKKP